MREEKVTSSKPYPTKRKVRGFALSMDAHCCRQLKVKCRQSERRGKRKAKRIRGELRKVSLESALFLEATIGRSVKYTSWTHCQRHSSVRHWTPHEDTEKEEGLCSSYGAVIRGIYALYLG